MDATRFDAFVKTLAARRSRRAAVRAGGAGLALGALRGRPARAQDATPVPIEPATVLYVQVAASGAFRPDRDGGGELTLTGVGAHTIWFTDRPAHRSGAVQTTDFAIGPVFASADPPNAALVAAVGGEEVVAVVELTNPQYDADVGTVRYEAVPVPGEPGKRVVRGARDLAEAVPEEFGSASLFIDGVACLPYGGSCARNSDCCSGQCLAFIVGGRIVDFLCT